MSKLILLIGAAVLAGCASRGEWRALSIDGSSEAAFQDSVTRLNDTLSERRRQYFALALVDIARTALEEAGEADDEGSDYTHDDFLTDLDGLTYDGVIALADETGMPVRALYFYSRRDYGPSVYNSPRGQGSPAFTTGGEPISDWRPGGANWPLGADARGRAIYP